MLGILGIRSFYTFYSVAMRGTEKLEKLKVNTRRQMVQEHELTVGDSEVQEKQVDTGKHEEHVATEDDKASTGSHKIANTTEPLLEEDDDEEEDDDYDPNAKPKPEEIPSDDEKLDEEKDYSSIQAAVTQVKTRSQRNHAVDTSSRYIGSYATDELGLVQHQSNIDVNSIFSDLNKLGGTNDWNTLIQITPEEKVEIEAKAQRKLDELNPDKIKIESSYAFAGKIITETKLVDANSAEAKAYLNSTSTITASKETHVRSFIPVMRKVPGIEEPVELFIKLKRPSLVDKFLAVQGSKKQKLSTLEKSRLDWASFVDHRKIGDDLKIGNRGGFLDKQDFLGRVQYKRDEKYQEAKEVERQKNWKAQLKS